MRPSLPLLVRKFTRKLLPAPSTALSRRAPAAAPPQQHQPASPPAAGSLMDTVKEGFAFGIGSAIARSVVGSIFSSFGGGDAGGGGDAPPPAQPPPPPEEDEDDF